MADYGLVWIGNRGGNGDNEDDDDRGEGEGDKEEVKKQVSEEGKDTQHHTTTTNAGFKFDVDKLLARIKVRHMLRTSSEGGDRL